MIQVPLLFAIKPIIPFKAVPGGYVFRAPTLAITGRPSHYFVNQQQKDAIEALHQSKHHMRSHIALVVWYTLCLLALVALLHVIPGALTVSGLAPFFAVMLLVPLIVRHVLIRRQLARLQPILSKAKLTDQVISNQEVLAATRSATSLKQTWISALLIGALSLVQLLMMDANRNPKIAMLSDANMLPWILQFVVYGLLAMAFFKATLDKIDMAVPSATAPPSFLRTPTRTVVLTVATIMVGVAVMFFVIAL